MYKYVFSLNRRLKISTIYFFVHIITKENNILVTRGFEQEMPLKTSKNKILILNNNVFSQSEHMCLWMHEKMF